jgi:hypothetical protein
MIVSLSGMQHKAICNEIAKLRCAFKIKKSGLHVMTLQHPSRVFPKVTHDVTVYLSGHTSPWEAFKSYDGQLILAMYTGHW